MPPLRQFCQQRIVSWVEPDLLQQKNIPSPPLTWEIWEFAGPKPVKPMQP